MRTKTVKRYFCDFCSKGMLRSDAMAKHENRCTANSNRHCGLCGKSRDYAPALNSLPKFEELLSEVEQQKVLESLRRSFTKCPACILTILRLRNVAGIFASTFRLEDEMKKYNEERNKREAEAEFYA